MVSTYAPFKERITYIRNYLKIPLDGFTTNEKASAWNHQKAIQSDEIMDSPEFRKNEEAITILFKNNKITRQEANRKLKEIYAVLPFNFLTRSVKELVKEFNLPESYHEALRYYIYRNEFFFVPAASYTVGPWDAGDSITEARYVPLRVYTKLTDEDLKEIKKEVNKYFGKNLPSFKNIRDLERNVEIDRTDTEGELDAVSYKFKTVDRALIAERFLGSAKKKPEIKKIKETLNKTRKNRFGKK